MTTKLVYPIFLECCQYTKDNFWKYIFEDLAYKKTPYGIYIYCDHICCNYKNKEFNYKIDITKNSKILYNDIYNLFSKQFELLSEKDKINRKNLFEKDSIEIKNKNKNNIIYIFIINIKNKWNLSIEQTKKLFSYILLMSLFKIIIPAQLIQNKQNLQVFKNIKFEENNIIFKKHILENLPIRTSLIEIIPEKKLSNVWKKYCRLFVKSS